MKKHLKSGLIAFCMIAALLAFTASPGDATLTCGCVPTGACDETTHDAYVVAAANFYTPLQSLIGDCQGTGKPCNGYHYWVCKDSTGNLETLIDADYNDHNHIFSVYDYFFAADATAAAYDGMGHAGTAYSYARGIPVFFALSANIDNVNKLITGATSSTIAAADLTSYSVNTTYVTSVALANSTAPYGVAAYAILNDLLPIYGSTNPVYNLPDGTRPGWVHFPYYSDIGVTMTNVTNGNNISGFVGKSQICGTNGQVPSTYTYIQFTDPTWTLDQKAILLDNTNSAANGLDSYISGMISGGTWNSWVQGKCYFSP